MKEPASLMMMPWYPRDFASSTIGWPFIAKAIYRQLLDVQWEMGHIPSDINQIKMIVGLHGNSFKNHWRLVGPKFPESNGVRRNQRLEKHRLRAQTAYAQRVLGAHIANAKRAHPNPNPKPNKESGEEALKSAFSEAELEANKQQLREVVAAIRRGSRIPH
jgi:hypothetical protein